MCIFSQPVVSVSDTQIFARLLPDGWQYLVYQMNFETRVRNAIILPLPVELPATDQGSLEFISFQKYPRFFADLDKGFPLARPETKTRSRGSDWAVDSAPGKLEVHEVGDFIASFVPRLPDFDRLDEQFRVSQESWDKIPRYSDFGFAVFQLKSLKGKPHPMAFKFRSRLTADGARSIFFPTVHIHDGEVHDREEFDHTLFLQAPEFDDACGAYQQRAQLIADPATGYVRSKWPAGEFCNSKTSRGVIDADALVHRLKMHGRLENKDVLARLDWSHTEHRSGLVRFGMWPAACALAGIASLKWLFNRRDLVTGASSASRTAS